LAARSGFSFAHVYEELRAMESAGLATSRFEGRAKVYRANLAHAQGNLVLSLLALPSSTQEETPAPEDRVIMGNLVRMGAPIPAPTEVPELSPEETMVRALKLARRNPTLARVLPTILARNAERLDWGEVKARARAMGERRTLGFFLELTGKLARQKKLVQAAADLADRRVKRSESFFISQKQGPFQKGLEKRNTPALAKKWHFTMNMPLESFALPFRKFSE
jgi:hypothetical protein